MKTFLKRITLALGVLIIAVFLYVAYDIYTVYKVLTVKLNSVESFPSKLSFKENEDLEFSVHSADNFYYQLYKLEELVVPVTNVKESKAFTQKDTYSPFHGLDWETNVKFSNQNFRSGYYYLKCWNKSDTAYAPFIIKPKVLPRIIVVASTTTWQAYNNWGGKSFYEDLRSTDLAKFIYSNLPETKPYDYLPTKRPLAYAKSELHGVENGIEELADFSKMTNFNGVNVGSHLIKGEWNLIWFLEHFGFEYGVVSLSDFERLPQSDQKKVYIFNTHSEYWSQTMLGRLRENIEKGDDVIFASGNNIYRAIEAYSHGIKVIENPVYDRDEISSIIGAFYTSETYLKVAPFSVIKSNHWVFNGVTDSVFGQYGASGYETDKICAASKGFETLAIGENQSGPAYMVIKEFEKGNFVFNASSVSFSKGLSRDSIIQKMMMNLLERSHKKEAMLINSKASSN